jgi:AGZA family xanthine/uracil permease-like MFS transporter
VLVRAVPRSIQLAGAVGIGLFIAFIGLQEGGLVHGDPNTLVAIGNLRAAPALLTLFGLAVGLVLLARGVRTAIFWALLAALAAALLTGVLKPPTHLLSVPAFALPGRQIDLLGALQLRYLPLILVLLFFALFDTLGTLMGVAHEAGFLRDGELPRIERALTADAAGMLGGALLGTSPVTSYIESGAGVGVGARTGLASVVTGLCLLLSLFFAPVVALVGQALGPGLNPVTAPALILVGILMVGAVREIDWTDPTEAAPAFFTALLMPLTFNISHGLAAGLIVYPLAKTAAGRAREVHWLIYALAGLFVLRYALLPV